MHCTVLLLLLFFLSGNISKASNEASSNVINWHQVSRRYFLHICVCWWMLLESGGSQSALYRNVAAPSLSPQTQTSFFFSSCSSSSPLPLPSHNKLQTKACMGQTKHGAGLFSLDITQTGPNIECQDSHIYTFMLVRLSSQLNWFCISLLRSNVKYSGINCSCFNLNMVSLRLPSTRVFVFAESEVTVDCVCISAFCRPFLLHHVRRVAPRRPASTSLSPHHLRAE